MVKTTAERNVEWRERLKRDGLTQITIIVPIADAPHFRDLAMAYRERKPMSEPKERLGRTPSAAQIRLAKAWATRAGLPLPDYLETHHLSLAGWIGYARTHYYIFSGRAGSEDEDDDMVFDFNAPDE